VVRCLYEAGYHLVALSNRDGDLRPLLANHGLCAFFTYTLSGGPAGVFKPDPEIFNIALRTLGVAPAATLAIGDSYDADILGAQKAGITAVLLDPTGIFPEAGCRTIRSLDELMTWLVPFES
jgi:putative hydrolase of the HAD superfamily